VDNSNRPDVRAYIGATGSGKGVSVRAHLKDSAPARLLVWDPLQEYGSFVSRTYGEAELGRLAQAAEAPAFRLAYFPGGNPDLFEARFEVFCRIAFSAGNCTVLVEELADVTTPSRASLAWRRVTTQGRHRGLRVIACSQRPAQVDKQFLGNCTYLRCFTLRYPADRQAMAGAMSANLAEIEALATVEGDRGTTINFLERDFRNSQKAVKGSIQVGAT
jgi:hypothetical protein